MLMTWWKSVDVDDYQLHFFMILCFACFHLRKIYTSYLKKKTVFHKFKSDTELSEGISQPVKLVACSSNKTALSLVTKYFQMH